jgi:hypothetical protein
LTEAGREHPLSYAQESLARRSESAINVPAVARIGVDPGKVREILAVLTARHGALRTVLTRGPDGRLGQRVLPAATLPLTVVEHDDRPAAVLPAVLLAGSEAPFRLTGELLARAELHRFGGGDLLMVWMHHAISDLVSSHLLAEEIGRLAVGGSLPAPGLQMADFAAEERAIRPTDRQWDHWSRVLPRIPDRGLPAGTPHQAVRPALPRLPAYVLDGLGRLAVAHRTTLTTVLAAAVLTAHAGDTGSDRAVLGLTISNRDDPRLRSTVGCLADQLPLAVDLGGRPTFGELVGRVREALIDAYDHRLPLGVLLPLLGRTEPPVFAVNLNFLPPPVRRRRDPIPDPAADLALPYGLTKRRAEPWWLGDAGIAYRPRVDAAGLAGEVEGDAHLHHPGEVRRRGERFCALLAAVSADPEKDVRTLAGAPAGTTEGLS